MANPISHRAVMVVLNQRAWKGKAVDREVAAQAEINANAEQGTMTVIKELTPKHLIQPIKTIMTVGRQEHYKKTIPGLFRGQAILPTKLFEDYMVEQQEFGDQFFGAVDNFVDIYPEIREKAKSKLGTSYKERDFPSAHAIRSYFDYKVLPGPIPEAGDFRLEGVSQENTSTFRNEVEEGVRQMYADATQTLFERARAHLENFHRQAKNYNVKAPGAMLRDPTIDQMREFAEMVCDMNITGDPLLEKIGKEMLKDFVDLSGKELRKSAEMREEIADKAKRILDKMTPIKRIAA
jgi:hypothetical protein